MSRSGRRVFVCGGGGVGVTRDFSAWKGTLRGQRAMSALLPASPASQSTPCCAGVTGSGVQMERRRSRTVHGRVVHTAYKIQALSSRFRCISSPSAPSVGANGRGDKAERQRAAHDLHSPFPPENMFKADCSGGWLARREPRVDRRDSLARVWIYAKA